MTPRKLQLDIVTPDGPALHQRDVERVVLRRRERSFAEGSEIAVFPLHAPTLIRIAVAPARYVTREGTIHLALAGGFAQVRGDRVLIVTPRCELAGAGAPARARAREVCASWAREGAGGRRDVIGYL